MYRLSWPLARFLASMGVPLLVKIEILYDPEATVYVATSPDLKGLIVEADSLDEIRTEVANLVPELLALAQFDSRKCPSADLLFTQHLSCV